MVSTVMSSSCPKRLRRGRNFIRGLPTDRPRPLKSKQLLFRVHRLHHAVRKQSQPVAEVKK
jgi:hypothetical protein